MAMPDIEVAAVAVSLVPSFKGGRKAIAKLLGEGMDDPAFEKKGEEGGKKFRKGFGSGFSAKSLIPTAAIAATGTAIIGLSKVSVQAASDAEQSIGGVQSIFGKAADDLIAKSEKAANTVGLDANAYRENANTIAALLKNQGTPIDELVGKTDNLIAKGADLAATFGGTTEEAVGALAAALKGEMDPMERYGVSLNEAAVKAEYAALGIEEMAKQNPILAKSMAVQSLITKQTADSMGQFGRESETLAGKQQRLGAIWGNMKITLGSALLPAVSDFLTVISEKGIPLVQGWVDQFRNGEGPIGTVKNVITGLVDGVSAVTGWFIEHKQTLIDLIPVMSTIAGLYSGWVVVTQTQKLFTAAKGIDLLSLKTKIFAGAQAALNVVMRANPIGIIITLVAGLIAGLTALWLTNKNFRNFVTAAWEKVKVAIGGVVDWFQTHVGPVISTVFGAISTVVGNVIGWFTGTAAPAISGFFGGIWEGVKFVANIFDDLARIWFAVVTGIIGWLAEKLGPAFDWLGDKISAVVGWVVEKVGWLGESIWGVITAVGGWFRDTFAPVFDWLGEKIGGALDFISGYFSWLKDSVLFIWDGIATGLKWVWDHSMGPVFGWLGNVLEQVVGAFRTVKDKIGEIWGAVTDLITIPIKSAFDWINENIISGLNGWLSTIPGVELRVPYLAFGFADGGIIPSNGRFGRTAMATGGVLPGYSPGRDIFSFFGNGMRLDLSGGEAILRPEVTRVLGKNWVDWMNMLARKGGVSGVRRALGFADGGVYEPARVTATGVPRANVNGVNVTVNVFVKAAPDAEYIRSEAEDVVLGELSHRTQLAGMRR